MEELKARYEILRNTLNLEGVVARLRASVLQVPPVPVPSTDEPPPADPPDSSETPGEEGGGGEAPLEAPPEDPGEVFAILKEIVEDIEREITNLKRALDTSTRRPDY